LLSEQTLFPKWLLPKLVDGAGEVNEGLVRWLLMSADRVES
jgi:hypothetical protein